MNFEIKPNKKPFVYLSFAYFLIASFVFSLVLITILILVEQAPQIIFVILLFLILDIIYYFHLLVSYNKEKYFFKGNKIIMKKGNLFSDSETELVIKKITQVKMNLPFIERKLYNTGDIAFKAAGSSEVEIFLFNIDQPDEVYKEIIKIMENNGFKLTRDKFLQKEKPSLFGMAIWGGIGVFNSAIVILVSLPGIMGALGALSPFLFLLAIPIIFLVIIAILIYYTMKIQKTTYYLYEDMIEYSEVFLNKNYSFIPIENLANSEITQNFWQQIFSLYDIKLSSQGSQNAIYFRMMKNGKTLSTYISDLISKTPCLEHKEEEKEVQKEKKEEIRVEKPKSDYTQELRIDLLRAVSPILLLIGIIILAIILIPTFIAILLQDSMILAMVLPTLGFVAIITIIPLTIYFVKQFITVNCTKFNINEDSISLEYRFLNVSRKEFTLDKTTSVIFKENIIDRNLNTISVIFTSIGSGQNINFRHINKNGEVLRNILLKTSIQTEEILHSTTSQFTFMDMLKANFTFSIIITTITTFLIFASILYPILLFLPITIILTITILFFFRKKYYTLSKIFFYNSYVFFQKGWIFQEKHHVLYTNVKDIISVKYPFSEKASLTFNVAGESFVGDPKSQNTPSLTSSTFEINYLPNISEYHNYCDQLLNKFPFSSNKMNLAEPNFSEKIVTVKPMVSNYLFNLILISIIIFPLIVILPITIPITMLVVSRISYTIQPERVIQEKGVIFRKKKTIIYNRIDHIKKGEGFVNKLFSNGNLEVLTIGSGTPEMVVKNIKGYNEIYTKLEEYYF